MVSLHTSPLLPPGTGDAGGLNVYVLQTALHLARRGVAVDIATRATSAQETGVVRRAPGVEVHHLPAGPVAPVRKEELPAHLDAFAEQLGLETLDTAPVQNAVNRLRRAGHIASVAQGQYELEDPYFADWIVTAGAS